MSVQTKPQTSLIPKLVEQAVENGWCVIPVRADKRPFIPWKAYQSRKPSLEEVQRWHSTFTPPAWAVVTGAVSDLIVLDFDGAKGEQTRDRLALAPHVRTGSGGTHVYFRHPGWSVRTLNGKSKQALGKEYPGLDIRGDGGYAVFAGTNKSGEYRWHRPMKPISLDVLPKELRTTLGLLHPPDLRANGGPPNPPRADRLPVERLIQRALDQSNSGRNDAGFHLAVQLRDNGYSQSEAEAVLEEYSSRVPTTNAKGEAEPYACREALASVRQAYRESPREPWPEQRASRIRVQGSQSALRNGRPLPADLEGFHFSDLSNAELLVRWHGDEMRFVHPWKSWLIWDRKRWKHDDSGAICRLAAATVRSLYSVARKIDDPEERKKLAGWAIKCESRNRLDSMVALAQNHLDIIVHPDQLDSDPWFLCVENGVIDLSTGKLRPHEPADLITKLAPVRYDPNAKAPRWLRFLAEVFEPHPDLISLIQRAVGYSLTGSTREECLFLLYGTGRNGKGTLIKKIDEALGDYTCTADFSTFVQRRYDSGPRDDVAQMAGMRFVSAQEASEGASLAESLIKWLTGGDRVRARRLYENSWEFDPTHKIWLATNHKPVIRGTDPAIWSRIKLIPFDVSFEGREDRNLKDTLTGELDGILTWAVAGCLAYQRDGLAFPESVTAATAEYRHETDAIGRFIEDRCAVGEYVQGWVRDLYAELKNWCAETGEEPMTMTAFGRRLVELGFRKKKKEKGVYYLGIGLKASG